MGNPLNKNMGNQIETGLIMRSIREFPIIIVVMG